MPQLIVPSPGQVRAVLAESHALWGAGLVLEAYTGMWEELAASPWGRAHYGWRAWVDDRGDVLSSLKLYRPALRLGGTVARAMAIGAVFTPRVHRRRGYAAALIRAVLAEEASPSPPPGFLFTDIGVAYYAALGFLPLPSEDAIGTLSGAASRAPAGVSLRTMTAADLDDVARAHDRFCEGRPIAILRDRLHWEFLLLRASSFFKRLDGSGLEQRFMIAMEGSHPIGYLVAVHGPGEWNVREAASFDGTDAALARILATGAAEAAAQGATAVWGWIPRGWWPLVPEWRLRLQPRLRAIPMLRPAGGALPPSLDTADGAFIPYLDQF